MTFVQPKKSNSTFLILLVLLFIALSVGTAWLVVLYNHAVNLEHAIATLEEDTRSLEIHNSELKEKMGALFASQNLGVFAAERGLIQEKSPHYFTDQQWVFASRL